MMNLSFLNLQVINVKSDDYNIKRIVSNQDDLFLIAKEVLKADVQAEEVVWAITLSPQNEITGIFEVFRGTLDELIIHPREVFKRVLMQNASGFVLVHNHPNGICSLSVEDIKATRRFKECADLLGLDFIDHIVIGDDGCESSKRIGII